MGALGCGCSMIAVVLAVVTAIPLLGWGNWIFTLPAAALAILLSLVGLVRSEQPSAALAGLLVGLMTLGWAIFRLTLGHGLI